ncbi:DUF676-domain-containing protein [Gymnopus androsaceus JB14]|uniref:DUF676-domain-containing protein n=1 Tax=Gymnopus androsaceus JB14 TaxID=1447944 RepID=A0A6A4HQB2_9AGAR|nr:DUF676-domain-containing protein [Gymnopus androsaceus JB14]
MASTSNDSPTPSNSVDSVHLLVLVHGMWGSPIHLAETARIAKEARPEIHVLLAETNREDSTYDGIDWGGERVAEEIIQEINRLREQGKHVRQFSITGYSLGGLVSRYVVGIFFQRGLFSPSSSEPISLIPMNFCTMATPHLGLCRYPTFISSLSHTLGPKLLSRTGEQFYLKDKWSKNGRPLLDIMADPNYVFYQALMQFKHVRIFANAINDLTVPYVTAAIELEDPFADHEATGLEVQFYPKYHPLIESYNLPSPPKPKHERKKKNAPFLPPFLQRRFPLNIVVYTFLPLLIPVFITLVLFRFTKASKSSRARIKLLEKKSEDSGSGSLMKALSHLERQIEDAVADAIDDPGSVSSTSTSPRSSSPLSSGTSTPAPTSNSTPPLTSPPSLLDPESSPSPNPKKSGQPILTPLQKTICGRLNSIPHLKKERAFIDGVRNSHATIVSRDVRNFEFHRVGEGVLRFWMDKFEV